MAEKMSRGDNTIRNQEIISTSVSKKLLLWLFGCFRCFTKKDFYAISSIKKTTTSADKFDYSSHPTGQTQCASPGWQSGVIGQDFSFSAAALTDSVRLYDTIPNTAEHITKTVKAINRTFVFIKRI